MYRYYVTKRKPVSIWMLDDTTPFQEYSGLGGSGIASTGTPTKSVPLVAGAWYSSVFKTGAVGRFDCNLFKRGTESRPFALEAWILPVPKTTTGVQKVLSHSDVDDGITINGKTVRFGTSYLTSGNSYCDYDLGEYKLAHVVGKHNADQNELWVNGELVATVALTDEQKGDSYATTNGDYLFCGTTASSQEVAVNAVAFYPSLSGDDIIRNYEAGIGVIGQDRVYTQYGGTSFDLNADAGSVFIRDAWLNKADFERGLNDNVNLAPDQIEPAYLDGISQAGTWTTSIPLDGMEDTSIYGVMLAWSGSGVDVDVSLDGTAWTPAVSGRLVSIIPNGYNPTGKDLRIRVSFDGGLADDPAHLEGITVVGLRNNTVANITARPVTVSHPAVLRDEFEPTLYRDDNGIGLNGGTLTIGADPGTDPDVARTLELWVKPLSGTPTISVGGTKYRNGFADSTLPVGEWSLIHYVADADIAGSITVSGDIIVGQATLYPTALSATEVARIWESYTGAQVVRFSDTSVIGVSEGPTPANVYAHDWAIDGAG